MISIKYRCAFVLSKDGSENDAPLRCRVRWDSSRCIVSLNVGYRVNPDRWDSGSQRCAVNSFHGRRRIPGGVINREIQRFSEAVDAVFSRIAGSDHWPSVDEVRTALRVELGIDEQRGDTVLEALSKYVKDCQHRGSWSGNTAAKFAQLRGHLCVWNGSPDWASFDERGLTDFVLSMQQEGLRNSTVYKMLGFLRMFLKWARAEGYHSSSAYEAFRPKFKSTQKRVIFLEWPELMRVWDYDPGEHGDTYALCRDVFCFCAFTSLRYSDAQALKWSDVSRDSIRVTTQKTQDSLRIELNRWSQEILGRYVDCPVEGDFVFPRIPNQLMNRELKVICRECGIDEPVRVTWFRGSERFDEVHPKYELIGTHCARRTFVCNALMMGISPSVVMRWTGHSDYKAMRPYIDIADSAKAQAMSLFDAKNKESET